MSLATYMSLHDKWHMFIPYHPPIRSLRSFLNRLDEMSLGLLWTRWINTSSTARASQDMPTDMSPTLFTPTCV